MSQIFSLMNPAAYMPTKPMDGLLRSVRLSGAAHATVTLTSPFGVEIAYEPDTLLFYYLVEGRCTMKTEGEATDLIIKSGDAVLVPPNRKHGFFLPATTQPINVRDLLARKLEPFAKDAAGNPTFGNMLQTSVVHGGGGEQMVMRMILMFADKHVPSPLINGLPTTIKLPGFFERHHSLIVSAYDEMDRQKDNSFMGQPIAIRLSEAILTMALMEAAEANADMFLFQGLGDKAVARVISAVIRNPRKDWNLDLLAKEAALSRSSLSTHFMAMLNQSPIEFVTHVRMTRASEMLRHSSLSIAAIAQEAAYGSEAAFNRAFRKWSGIAPGAFRAKAAAGDSIHDPLMPK